jgi:3-phosphoshikimate 1-carboxyvinyltransferase
MEIKLQRKGKAVNGSYKLPGDKSIGHRSLLIGALGEGRYKITNFPKSLDCLSTLDCMRALGVEITFRDQELLVSSPGYRNFSKAERLLNANNSGTTARLLSGIAAGAHLNCIIQGDYSLRKRPMNRIIEPLRKMGASINSEEGYLPLSFSEGEPLAGITYALPVASAQVKSCILIAGFLAKGKTTVVEKLPTRDHTERMFQFLGADIQIQNNSITISNSEILTEDLHIPGDISSAAFLVVCALLSENSKIVMEDVLLNEGRRQYLDVLIKMGAQIEYKVTEVKNNEKIGYVKVSSSLLKGIEISREEIPSIIDEIPVLAVAAAFANGKTRIEGISELKYKESNRIKAIGENLRNCGFDIDYSEEAMEINGCHCLVNKDIVINPYNDHRIALAFTAFAVRNLGSTTIENFECTDISFPKSIEYFKDFFNI